MFVFNNNNMKYIFQRSSDTAVLLTKNEIKAVKKMVFSVVRQTLKIKKMNTDFHACSVDLSSVLVWAIREQCLVSSDQETMEFNIKLDGRPLGGIVCNFHFCFHSFTSKTVAMSAGIYIIL